MTSEVLTTLFLLAIVCIIIIASEISYRRDRRAWRQPMLDRLERAMDPDKFKDKG